MSIRWAGSIAVDDGRTTRSSLSVKCNTCCDSESTLVEAVDSEVCYVPRKSIIFVGSNL